MRSLARWLHEIRLSDYPKSEVTLSPTNEPAVRKTDASRAQSTRRGDRSPGSKATTSAAMPPRKTWKWFLFAVILNYLLFRFIIPSGTAPVAVPYTFFKAEVHRRNVKAIYGHGETITGKFSSPVNSPPIPTKDTKSASTAESKKVTDFTTILPAFVDPGWKHS